MIEETLRKRWYVHQSGLRRREEQYRNQSQIQKSGFIKTNEEQWKALEKNQLLLYYNDIPWINPNVHGDFLREVASIDKTTRKRLLLRWHPDSFNYRFGNRINLDEYDMINKKVNETCQEILAVLKNCPSIDPL